MAEAVLSFAFRVSHNGLGGVYLEAALAGASGIVALGAKTVSKLREGTREPADGSGTPVDARSANVTVQCHDGDRVANYALAEGPTTPLEPVRVAVAELTRRLTVQPPLPTLQSSSSYANINDTELSTNILYAQHDPIDMTSAKTNLKYNLTIPAKFVAFNDSSITASDTDSNVPYATSLPPHMSITSICLLGPVLFVLAAIVVRSILQRLYLVFARRPIPTTGHIVEVSSSILARAVALFCPAALQVEAHTVAFPPFSSPSKRSDGNPALAAVKEEGDALEEDAIHGDSAEDIDGGASAQGGDTDAPVGEDGQQHDYLDEPVAAAEDIEVGKARIPQEGTELLGTPLSTPHVPTNVLPRSKPMNDADADDDATEPQLPVLARIKAWEQGRRAAGREDDVQAGTDPVKRSGDLLASPVLMDNVDDEEELPPAPVVERIKAWEQTRTVVRRASVRKSARRADDVRAGAEIAKGGENQRGAPAPIGTDAGAHSPALSDGRIEAGADDADEQSPPIETGMRSVASLKRLYEPFLFRLADSAFAAD